MDDAAHAGFYLLRIGIREPGAIRARIESLGWIQNVAAGHTTHDSPAVMQSYCAKYAKISTTRCTGLLAYALIHPLSVGTIARFEVIVPSTAFNVDASGRVCPSGHNVRYPIGAGGTAVTPSTWAWAVDGIPQALPLTAGKSSDLSSRSNR